MGMAQNLCRITTLATHLERYHQVDDHLILNLIYALIIYIHFCASAVFWHP